MASVRVSSGCYGLAEDRTSPRGTLTFVDLAGKENASKAGNMGDDMLKSKTNSRSLYFLEQCIDVLKFNVTNSAGEIRKIPMAELQGIPNIFSLLCKA